MKSIFVLLATVALLPACAESRDVPRQWMFPQKAFFEERLICPDFSVNAAILPDTKACAYRTGGRCIMCVAAWNGESRPDIAQAQCHAFVDAAQEQALWMSLNRSHAFFGTFTQTFVESFRPQRETPSVDILFQKDQASSQNPEDGCTPDFRVQVERFPEPS